MNGERGMQMRPGNDPQFLVDLFTDPSSFSSSSSSSSTPSSSSSPVIPSPAIIPPPPRRSSPRTSYQRAPSFHGTHGVAAVPSQGTTSSVRHASESSAFFFSDVSSSVPAGGSSYASSTSTLGLPPNLSPPIVAHNHNVFHADRGCTPWEAPNGQGAGHGGEVNFAIAPGSTGGIPSVGERVGPVNFDFDFDFSAKAMASSKERPVTSPSKGLSLVSSSISTSTSACSTSSSATGSSNTFAFPSPTPSPYMASPTLFPPQPHTASRASQLRAASPTQSTYQLSSPNDSGLFSNLLTAVPGTLWAMPSSSSSSSSSSSLSSSSSSLSSSGTSLVSSLPSSSSSSSSLLASSTLGSGGLSVAWLSSSSLNAVSSSLTSAALGRAGGAMASSSSSPPVAGDKSAGKRTALPPSEKTPRMQPIGGGGGGGGGRGRGRGSSLPPLSALPTTQNFPLLETDGCELSPVIGLAAPLSRGASSESDPAPTSVSPASFVNLHSGTILSPLPPWNETGDNTTSSSSSSSSSFFGSAVSFPAADPIHDPTGVPSVLSPDVVPIANPPGKDEFDILLRSRSQISGGRRALSPPLSSSPPPATFMASQVQPAESVPRKAFGAVGPTTEWETFSDSSESTGPPHIHSAGEEWAGREAGDVPASSNRRDGLDRDNVSAGFRSSPSSKKLRGWDSGGEGALAGKGLSGEGGSVTKKLTMKNALGDSVDLSRPVSLELRPTPMRRSHGDHPVRAMACLRTSVWVAFEDGIRIWDLGDAFETGSGGVRGDEGAAPSSLIRVHGSKTLCLTGDTVKGIVFSGHSDGRVSVWSVEKLRHSHDEAGSFQDSVRWNASSKFDVTALVFSSYGDLWVGFENGVIRVWKWDSVRKGLEDGYMAHTADMVELPKREIGGGGGGGGSPSPVHSEIRFLVSDRANGRVWSAGSHSIAVWDARTLDLLNHSSSSFEKYETTPGYRVPSRETSPVRVEAEHERERGKERAGESQSKFTKLQKKEKKEGWSGVSLIMKGVMGAADVMKKVASAGGGGGAAGDDSKKLGAFVSGTDGSVWAGFADGRVVRWDTLPHRTYVTQLSASVRCMCITGVQLWVGLSDGSVAIQTGDGKWQRWRAHKSELFGMECGGDHVFTLAADGGIRGWHVNSAGLLKEPLQKAMQDKSELYTIRKRINVWVATWNVNEQKPKPNSIEKWFGEAGRTADIVIVGLQEMETGAGTLAVAGAKEMVGMGLQERFSGNAHSWMSAIQEFLGLDWEKLGSRQLAGMLICVWNIGRLRPFLGEVETDAVSCGFGRALGNKGAVGVRVNLFRRSVCFLNSHLAAHTEAVARRNEDFWHISQRMAFGNKSGMVASAANVANAAVSGFTNIWKGSGRGKGNIGNPYDLDSEGDEGEFQDGMVIGEFGSQPGQDLAEAELLIWTGDFNYRLDSVSYDEALHYIEKRDWAMLQKNDQLLLEMTDRASEKSSRRAFQGMREGRLDFPPTYKFDRGVARPMAYDSSEKQRVPAWCDRVLFRDSYGGAGDVPEGKRTALSLPVHVQVQRYGTCLDVYESDHKPVFALLDVEMAVVNEGRRRWEYNCAMHENKRIVDGLEAVARELKGSLVAPRRVALDAGSASSLLHVANLSERESVVFCVTAEGEPVSGKCDCGTDHGKRSTTGVLGSERGGGGGGFPRWLQVRPAGGEIPAGKAFDIELQAVDLEDDADRAVVLLISVTSSTGLIGDDAHRRVCVCLGGKSSSRWTPENSERRPSRAARHSKHDLPLASAATRTSRPGSSSSHTAASSGYVWDMISPQGPSATASTSTNDQVPRSQSPPPPLTDLLGLDGGQPSLQLTNLLGLEDGQPSRQSTNLLGLDDGQPSRQLTDLLGLDGGQPSRQLTDLLGLDGGQPSRQLTNPVVDLGDLNNGWPGRTKVTETWEEFKS